MFRMLITHLDDEPLAALERRLRGAEMLSAAARGRCFVQLRQPDWSARALLKAARALRKVTQRYGIKLLINERIDVAMASEADGVHLPSRGVSVSAVRNLLGPHAVVSTVAHAPEDVFEVAGMGADMILLSPIFSSPGKATPLGLGAIKNAKRTLVEATCHVKLLALGGISAERVGPCLKSGADGVAAIRWNVLEA